VINGQGISVAQAIIRGGDENPITQAHLQELGDVPQPPSGKRVIQMWLKETHTGNKLVRVIGCNGLVWGSNC
jgi:hypothetical protein